MELIIDANILFSALIKDSHTRNFLLLSEHTFYTSEFVFDEVKKHINVISEKTLLSNDEIKFLLDDIITLANIRIIPANDYESYIEKAKQICPDINDV